MLVHTLSVLVFHELSELLGLLADSTCLPLTHSTRWFRLEQARLVLIEASEEGRDTVGSHAATLGVLLLNLAHVVCNVVDRRLIFVLKAERLALEADFVDEDTGIGLQSRESQHQVLVDSLDFADSARVLKLGHSVLLNGHHDAVGAGNSNRCTAAVDGLKGVLHLE